MAAKWLGRVVGTESATRWCMWQVTPRRVEAYDDNARVTPGRMGRTKEQPLKTQQLTSSGTSDMATRYALIVYHRDGAEVAPLRPEAPLVVGRVAPADLVVADSSLSRQHACFVLDDDAVTVTDLDSTNGTWIGGDKIESARIRPGEVVTLGAVTAVVQALGGQPRLGLEGHDRFVWLLEREATRAQHFGRPLSILMVSASERALGVHRWNRALEGTRAVDTVALYGGDSVEIMLPETGADEARALAERIVASAGDGVLCCGVATFPDAAVTGDALIAAAREALYTTSRGQPIVSAPSRGVRSSVAADGVVSADPAMKSVFKMARRVARGDIPVLLHGETGCGKEVLANFIHREGPRSGNPLVAVNCAAIPTQLVESTLFGHEKGAFTGADRERAGVFEAADGGTVLLDEIGDLPADAQATLLRVLETGTITRVGSTRELRVDVRVIAASHRDLERMCAEGGFREDLLYRLNAVTIEIPPLRERPVDVLAMAELFLADANRRNDRAITGFSKEVQAALTSYHWPGNIRELRNVVERAVVIAEHDVIDIRDLSQRIHVASSAAGDQPDQRAGLEARTTGAGGVRHNGESFRECVERLEAEIILGALRETSGNQTEAARVLDMPRRTLVHKIKTLGIARGDYRRES